LFSNRETTALSDDNLANLDHVQWKNANTQWFCFSEGYSSCERVRCTVPL